MQRKYFNRKWKITITSLNGKEWTVSSSNFHVPLKCKFTIGRRLSIINGFCDLEIWNLNEKMTEMVIEEGYGVKIEAGYQDGPYGQIFSGEVFRPTFERDMDKIGYKVTLNCIDNPDLSKGNLVSYVEKADTEYLAMVSKMAKSARNPISIGGISPNLSAQKLPRAKVFFGDPRGYINRIAETSNGIAFTKDGEVHIAKMDDEQTLDTIVLKPPPEGGLIGTPKQTQYGVEFKHLLDSRIALTAPLSVVKLCNSTVILIPRERLEDKVAPVLEPNTEEERKKQNKKLSDDFEKQKLFSRLSDDGEYKVVGVKYTGDTRDNDWYVEVIGVDKVGEGTPFKGQLTA
jgi:hypothetical protein